MSNAKVDARIAMLTTGINKIQDMCAGDALPNWENTPHTTNTRGRILDITNFCLGANEKDVSVWLQSEKDKALNVQREQIAQFAEQLGFKGFAVALRHGEDHGRTIKSEQEGWCSHGVSLKNHCTKCGL